MCLIFVYGTLKSGERNHHVLEGAAYVGDFVTRPWYNLHSDGIPFLVKGDKEVAGEVYAVGSELMDRLDRLEGHPRFYRREVIGIQGLDMEVEAYFYNGSVRQVPQWTETDEDGALNWRG